MFGGSEASSANFKSREVEDGALDLFTVPPTNITYNGYRIVEINPTSESITPIEFVIPGSREYIDFSRSYFRMDLILKKNRWRKSGCCIATLVGSKRISHHHQTTFHLREWDSDHRTNRHVRIQSISGKHTQLWNRRWGNDSQTSRVLLSSKLST